MRIVEVDLDSEDSQKKLIEAFVRCFGGWDVNFVPGFVVLVCDGDDVKSFFSYYWHNAKCIYIQYYGHLPTLTDSERAEAYNIFTKYIHDKARYIVCSIKSDNTHAIGYGLKHGWTVIGSRYLVDTLFIEMMRDGGLHG